MPNISKTDNKSNKELLIKNPAWALYFGIIGGVVFLIAFLVFLYLKRLDRIGDDISFLTYIFLGLFLLFAVLTYICILFFYGENNTVLIKIIDDGTVSENSEEFIRSLKSNRIKIKREEKHIEVK